jgi:replication factor A1
MYTPIRVLNQFSTDWKIRARLTKKDEPKAWKNQKGEGVLMNMELMDKDGTLIQATFFGQDTIQKYGSILKENKVYLFSNGQVRIANKKFTSIKNDYCLIFD